jgi:hypothetical protein
MREKGVQIGHNREFIAGQQAVQTGEKSGLCGVYGKKNQRQQKKFRIKSKP